MKKEKGHGSREGGGAFLSNTNYIKKKLTMKKEKGHGSREGGGAFLSNTTHHIEI
jgi:hypothetical protein